MLKRTLLCLALALVLCLGLCACDSELPPEKLEPLYGTWLADYAWDGKVLDDGSPFTITLTKDGQCTFNGEGGMTWEAREIRDSSNLQIRIREDKKIIYSFIVCPQDNGSYSGELLTYRKEEWVGMYLRPSSTEIYTELLDNLCAIQWSPKEDSDLQFPVTINADGTCVVDGNPYYWAVHPWADPNRDYLEAIIYNNSQSLYYFNAHMNPTGLPGFSMNDINWKAHGSFNWHPLQAVLLNWDPWYPFDQSNDFSNYVNVGSESLHANNETFNWEISDSTTDEQIVICVPNAAAPTYVISMTMNGEYPQMALEVKETGEIINYYNQSYGFDPANPEAIYYDAVQAINCYLNDNYYWNEALENSLHNEEILPYAYARFQEVADYKESQGYLDRFTIVPNKLVSVTRAYTDRLGNTGESTNYSYYNYDTEGRLSSFYDRNAMETFGVYDLQNYRGYLTYGNNDVITDLTLKSGSDIHAKCTPTYDETGKLISMHVQRNSDDYSSTFTYNEQGQLVQVEIPYYNNYIYTYTYDEAGILTQKEYSFGRNYHIVTDYVYENGLLVQEIANYEEYRETWTVVTTYTYDADGNLLSESISSDNPNYSLSKEEYLCVYKDVYFYSAE